MQVLEDGFVDLRPGGAHARRSDGFGLRQRNAASPALLPERGKGRRVAVAREHQPIDEEHHEQSVDDPPPELPDTVVGRRSRGCRADEFLPGEQEGVVCGEPGRRPWLRLAPRRSALRAMQENLPEVRAQRIDVDPFGRFPLAAPGLAEIEPVRRPVAGAIEAARIHKRLYQYRTAAVLLLPVIGQPPHRHRQHLGSQVPDLDPRKQQKPRVAHHPLQMRLPPVLRPADQWHSDRCNGLGAICPVAGNLLI